MNQIQILLYDNYKNGISEQSKYNILNKELSILNGFNSITN